MRQFLLLAALVAFASLADAQTGAARITGDQVIDGARAKSRPFPGTTGGVIEAEELIRLSGNVILTTDIGMIRADEATVHPRTNSVELRGNVTVQLASPPVVSR